MNKSQELIQKCEAVKNKNYRIKVTTKRGARSFSDWMTEKEAKEMIKILRAQFPESTHALTQS